jgi:hypothetical protein
MLLRKYDQSVTDSRMLASHFLPMMVRAPRAVDLVAKSELAFCSHARRLTELGFAEVFGLTGGHREQIDGRERRASPNPPRSS